MGGAATERNEGETHLEATSNTYLTQPQTFEADEENFSYDTSKDPNYDRDGDLMDTRKMLTGEAVKSNTAFVYTDNANYDGEIESLKDGDNESYGRFKIKAMHVRDKY
ncbi:hypothetical protein [Staphylococcus americanisciuri]|uniref:Uncharacterized protein n=1 Tax=Staphylococcus americanisciuri TaxID=2973940 RepID=A0ABT2F1R2_9STAP|nr:hypothetical protein [Staphylococcus americanisciuri]MCS4485757.1 hypothetical protein [Staphylococcus americanisciuri]